MPNQPFILFAGDSSWRIGAIDGASARLFDVPLPESRSANDLALAIHRALDEIDYANQPIVLALPSAWCFAASIDADDIPRHDRQALLYKFEEKLPVSAEEIVADFVPHDKRALGVGVPIAKIAKIIEALEARGVTIQTVTPAAILAAQNARVDEGHAVLVWGDGESADLIALTGRTPTAWAVAPSTNSDIRLQLELIAATEGAQPLVYLAGLDDTLTTKLAEFQPRRLAGSSSRDVNAVEAAAAILAGRQRPWIELRRGSVGVQDQFRQHRRALNAALAALATLFIVIAGVFFYRAYRYDRLSQQDDRALLDAFHAQYPGWATPASVRTVLESERRKLVSRDSRDLPVQPEQSALVTLRTALAKVPPDVRFTMDRMTFTETTFQLEGKARSLTDADAVATAARQAGLAVDPPRTQRMPDGSWSFTIHGTRAGKAPAAVARQQ